MVYSKQEAQALVGKRVIVNSNRVQNALGLVTSYIAKTHHVWVFLDVAIKGVNGWLSKWHKANAGNVKVIN